MLAYDLCERGLKLMNVFDSTVATELGRTMAAGFLLAAAIAAGAFFIFLCVQLYRVIMNLRSRQVRRISSTPREVKNSRQKLSET